MKQELQEKLYKDFPKLYRQHSLPMSQTCMCWGFSCGDGWYDFLYELSEKLENLIKKQLLLDEDNVCFCGHHKEQHTLHGMCTYTCKLSRARYRFYSFVVPKSKMLYALKKARSRAFRILDSILYFITPIFYKRYNCQCSEYNQYHASAAQVKEKFGTLRFYMDGATDEMEELITEAENKSAVTCEMCGNSGKIRGTGWVTTLCDECHMKKNKVDEELNDE